MPRIKITGYVHTEDLDPDHVDLGDATGLSAEGYDQLLTMGGEDQLTVSSLEDVETELVDD